MNLVRSTAARVRDFFRRRQIADAFHAEMEFHLEELTAEFERQGMSRGEAERAARLRFGNLLQARENVREQAGFAWLDSWTGDARSSVRALLRRPWFAVSTMLVLALGFAAAIVVFAVLDPVLLRPLPVPQPRELHALVASDDPHRTYSRGTVQRLETLLEEPVAAYSSPNRVSAQVGSAPAAAATLRLVNGNFFRALHVSTLAGRTLLPGDDAAPGGRPVAVVAQHWAVQLFGSIEDAIGAEVLVNRVRLQIVGVLPAEFGDVGPGRRIDLWLPTALQNPINFTGNRHSISTTERPADPDWNRDERVSWLRVLVRTSEPARASARLGLAFRPQAEEMAAALDNEAERNALRQIRLQLAPAASGDGSMRQGMIGPGLLLGSMVGVLLLVTCTNVSGLLLVRAMARVKELGVRLALGAGASRVARLAVLEALILSVGGSVGGMVLAHWLAPVAAEWLSTGVHQVEIGARSLGLLTLLVVVTTLAAAVAPIWWVTKLDPRCAFGEAPIGGRPLRLGRFFVAVQFALAALLVALAQSLAGQLERMSYIDPGVSTRQVLTVSFDASTAGYSHEERRGLAERLRTAAVSVAGVEAATFASSGFMIGSQSRSGLFFRSPTARTQRGHYQHDAVPPGYFATIGARLLHGRDFATSDRDNSPRVAIVSAAFAREVYGDQEPIGQRFGFGTQAGDEDWTIVGVVSDIHANGIRAASPAIFYTPTAQWDSEVRFLAVRTRAPVAEVGPAVRKALGEAAPGVLFTRWKTAEERIRDDLQPQRSGTTAATAFAGFAVLLAGCGVAASVGYLVLLRRREFAVRLALGATPVLVRRGVLAASAKLAVIGTVPGIALAWYLTRLPVLSPALTPLGGLAACGAAAVAILAALAAGWVPARRASQFDPNTLLRLE